MKGKVRRGCGGPCNHCGRTCSPCWRKGPPEKPVLCNACGARYLVKRNLEGYMPGQKATGGGGPREAPRIEARGSTSCDRASSGSSDRSTGDRRSVSCSSGSHSPGARTRRRRRVLYRAGDDHLEWDLMETDQPGPDEGCSYGGFEVGGRGKFEGGPLASNQEYLEDLAHVAAYTLAMLRYSGLHLKAAKGHVVRRGAVVKPVQHRFRIINHG